jgi:hypothetical protein
MIELGLAKAKRKDNNEWIEGYIFKYEKFNGENNTQYFIMRTEQNDASLPAMQNPLGTYQVWEETICFYTTAISKLTGERLFQNDILEADYGLESLGKAFIVWNEKEYAFFVDSEAKSNGFMLSDYLDCKVVGNLKDDFNLSKKEKKAKKKTNVTDIAQYKQEKGLK